MIIGGFLKNGGDLSKVKWADVGSGTRLRALLSKRVQAQSFRSGAGNQKSGNYKVILVPS